MGGTEVLYVGPQMNRSKAIPTLLSACGFGSFFCNKNCFKASIMIEELLAE